MYTENRDGNDGNHGENRIRYRQAEWSVQNMLPERAQTTNELQVEGLDGRVQECLAMADKLWQERVQALQTELEAKNIGFIDHMGYKAGDRQNVVCVPSSFRPDSSVSIVGESEEEYADRIKRRAFDLAKLVEVHAETEGHAVRVHIEVDLYKKRKINISLGTKSAMVMVSGEMGRDGSFGDYRVAYRADDDFSLEEPSIIQNIRDTLLALYKKRLDFTKRYWEGKHLLSRRKIGEEDNTMLFNVERKGDDTTYDLLWTYPSWYMVPLMNREIEVPPILEQLMQYIENILKDLSSEDRQLNPLEFREVGFPKAPGYDRSIFPITEAQMPQVDEYVRKQIALLEQASQQAQARLEKDERLGLDPDRYLNERDFEQYCEMKSAEISANIQELEAMREHLGARNLDRIRADKKTLDMEDLSNWHSLLT